jgi:antitoxin ParD1/3/4
MPKSLTLNVRVNRSLGEFVAANVGDAGTYENVSEYVRDLIRKDKERVELEMFERLKAELRLAFAEPDDSFVPLTAKDVIARNAARKAA